nr:DUF4013 domain-containing protein [Oscillochloris sp. ZM17-4]
MRAAVATVARDRSWPLTCLIYGACALTLIGLPIAAGFALDSLDNTRKGYGYPLPPWTDWTLRWLSGILALLIDFVFFVLPLLAGGMLLICVSIGMLVAGVKDPAVTGQALTALVALCGLATVVMFLCSAAPVGRLLFAGEGRIEDALSMRVLQLATSRGAGPIFLRARLLSLPAYLPAALLALAAYGLTLISFPGQPLALMLLVWLLLSALVMAHLVVVQLYAAAERETMRMI